MTTLEPREDPYPLTSRLFPQDDWAHDFIKLYAGEKGLAVPEYVCRELGIDRDIYLERWNTDPDFKAAITRGNDQVRALAVHALLDRAINGTISPLVSRGRVIGTTITYDNKLLQWVVERLAPDRFDQEMVRRENTSDAPDTWHFPMSDDPPENPVQE